jgi:large subunit ribosomal protein L29
MRRKELPELDDDFAQELGDQLFKLKFQMNMGQTESLKKVRGLRRDIARVKTILREQELGIGKTAKTEKK